MMCKKNNYMGVGYINNQKNNNTDLNVNHMEFECTYKGICSKTMNLHSRKKKTALLPILEPRNPDSYNQDFVMRHHDHAYFPLNRCLGQGWRT